MSRPYPTRHVVKVLEHQGFALISQHGSHAKYKKRTKNATLTVIVPIHGKEIPYGTFRSILRQSHLEEKDFTK